MHANRILQTCKHSQPVALTEKGIHGDADRRTYTYKATTNVDGLNESDGGTPRSASDQNHGSPKAVTGKHGGGRVDDDAFDEADGVVPTGATKGR